MRSMTNCEPRLAGVANYFKDFVYRIGNRFAAKAGPGDVVIDGARLSQLGPKIDEQNVADLNVRGAFASRFVVRIGSVRVDGDNRAMVAIKTLCE